MKRTFVLVLFAALTFGAFTASSAPAATEPWSATTFGVCTIKGRIAVQPRLRDGGTATSFGTRIDGTLRCFGGTHTGDGPDVVGGRIHAEFTTARPATCTSLDWLYENGFAAQVKWKVGRANFGIAPSTIAIAKADGYGTTNNPLRYLLGGTIGGGSFAGTPVRLTLSTAVTDASLAQQCAGAGVHRLSLVEAESTVTDTV